MIEFTMPSLGADMEAGRLIEWRVKPGDRVTRGDVIAEVETQKGTIEIEVFHDGTIEQILVREEEEAPVGKVLALIKPLVSTGDGVSEGEVNGHGSAGSSLESATQKPLASHVREAHPIEEVATDSGRKQPVSAKPVSRRIRATPLARKMAEKNGLDLSDISGTGDAGAITKQDVERAIAERGAPENSSGNASHQGDTAQHSVSDPTQGVRAAVAAAMAKSNREIPHYYLENRIDMQRALQWLAAENAHRPVQKRLLNAALLIRAVGLALRQTPDLNAEWNNGLCRKRDINVGFVVSLRAGGLIVPAIKQADKKSVDEIMEALNDIVPRARRLQLRSSELSESTVTISSLGDNGADKVFGLIYPPQVALVGFGTVTDQAWAENGMLGVRPVLHATLAGDHRATDGLTGSRFLGHVKHYLEHPEEL